MEGKMVWYGMSLYIGFHGCVAVLTVKYRNKIIKATLIIYFFKSI